MNKKGKFRGMHIHVLEENKHLDNTWAYGYLCGKGDYIETEEGIEKLIDSDTAGQYIGMTDKNGKEIYEGDIVIIRDGQLDEEDGFFVIKYDEGTARFVLNGDSLEYDFDSIDQKKCEITGNIYENLELLDLDFLKERIKR